MMFVVFGQLGSTTGGAQSSDEVADETAPTLTNPDATAISDTVIELSVDTDDNTGTIYWVVTQVEGEPSAAQIKAGQDSNSDPADDSDSIMVGMTGTQQDSATGLEPETEYFAYWVHTDPSDNDSNIVTDSDTTEPPADTTAPSVIALFPEDDATDVELDTHIEVAFDEDIVSGGASLQVRLYKLDGEPELIQTFTSADLGVISQIIGHTYAATPTDPLDPSTDYAVQYDMGSFEDAAGNPVAGVDDFTSWNFTTEELDVTAPVLTFPDIVALTSTTAALTVDSTEGNGRMFVIVTTVFTETTAEQIKNGLDGNNNPAVYANDFNVESVGTQYDTATGLEPETEYFAYWVHEDDAENDSNIVTDSDTTPAAAVDSLLMLDSGGVSLLHLGMI